MDRSFTLEYIEWLDAESTEKWTDIADLLKDEELPVIKTVGFVVKETKTFLLLCMQVDYKNDVSSMTMKIPKGMITKREIIS
jgi:hypothetical protein